VSYRRKQLNAKIDHGQRRQLTADTCKLDEEFYVIVPSDKKNLKMRRRTNGAITFAPNDIWGQSNNTVFQQILISVYQSPCCKLLFNEKLQDC
jgi:hypothetical protein